MQHSGGVSQGQNRGAGSPPCPAAHAPLDAAWDMVLFLGCEHTLLAPSEFLSTITPKLFSQGCSQSVLCPACRCAWDCSDPDIGPCISFCSSLSLRIICWTFKPAPVTIDAMAIAYFLDITWLRLVFQPPGESLCCHSLLCDLVSRAKL